MSWWESLVSQGMLYSTQGKECRDGEETCSTPITQARIHTCVNSIPNQRLSLLWSVSYLLIFLPNFWGCCNKSGMRRGRAWAEEVGRKWSWKHRRVGDEGRRCFLSEEDLKKRKENCKKECRQSVATVLPQKKKAHSEVYLKHTICSAINHFVDMQ